MLAFDEINALVANHGYRSIDIDQYFDEMDLSDMDREDRKAFARRMRDEIFLVFSMIHLALTYNAQNSIINARNYLRDAFLSAINEFTVADSFLTKYAETFADEIVEATVRNQGGVFEGDTTEYDNGAYFFSDDRATFIAENEANVVFNYEQYRDAVRWGMKYKQWITMRDERVRHTHALVDGVIVKIDEFFHVGDCQMRFCKDVLYGTPEEVINCRCVTRYLTEEQFKEILRTE